MKASGIVRQLDELGRIVLPMELRRMMSLEYKDNLEITVNGNEIILTKYVPRCIFCKGEDDVREKQGRHICRKCINEI